MYDGEGGALPLLEDYFSAATLEESRAWTSGQVVDDDATVEAWFEASVGATPHRELSALFRRIVKSAYHLPGPSANGA